jgi:hypothetical protein
MVRLFTTIPIIGDIDFTPAENLPTGRSVLLGELEMFGIGSDGVLGFVFSVFVRRVVCVQVAKVSRSSNCWW